MAQCRDLNFSSLGFASWETHYCSLLGKNYYAGRQRVNTIWVRIIRKIIRQFNQDQLYILRVFSIFCSLLHTILFLFWTILSFRFNIFFHSIEKAKRDLFSLYIFKQLFEIRIVVFLSKVAAFLWLIGKNSVYSADYHQLSWRIQEQIFFLVHLLPWSTFLSWFAPLILNQIANCVLLISKIF